MVDQNKLSKHQPFRPHLARPCRSEVLAPFVYLCRRIVGYAFPLLTCWVVTAIMYVLASWHIDQGHHFITNTPDRNSPHEVCP